jgi:hypothetical protein
LYSGPMIELDKLLRQAGREQMHSQAIDHRAIGGNEERFESYGKPTLVKDSVYVRAK